MASDWLHKSEQPIRSQVSKFNQLLTRLQLISFHFSRITSLANTSFEGLAALRVLHLEDNALERLQGNEFTGLTRLTELYLHNNFLSSVARTTFHALRALSILRLDGNLLTSFPVWELVNNPALTALHLARNMWACDCEFVRPLRAAADKLGDKVRDARQLRCVADHYRGEALSPLELVDCSGSLKTDLSSSPGGLATGLDYTPILVSVLLVVLVIIITYLVAFTFRKNIQAWMARRRKTGDGGASTGTAATNDTKLFDVFISYAREDADFVEQNFAPQLGAGYRLCLHQRDFPPTTPLADTVAVAVESSTRAVVVLSAAYLRAPWPTIRTAFLDAILANNTKVKFEFDISIKSIFFSI